MPPQTTRNDRARARSEQRQAAAAGVLPADVETTTGEIVRVDPLKQMLQSWKSDIVDQMPLQMKVNPDAFMRLVLTGMRTSKQAVALAKCSRPSLFGALLECARFGLTPFTEEAAIVPYGTEATFVPMAGGFVKMFWNTGQISGVVVDFIRVGEVRGEDWELTRGAGGSFWHRPPLLTDDEGQLIRPGEPFLAYCYLRMRDGTMTEPAMVPRWDAEDVMTTKSKAWANAERTGKHDSLWHTDFLAMWRKTAVRRVAKYGPKSAELQELLLIEAREDRTRDDALPALQAAPPMGSGVTIDWTKDIDGGHVVAGTVVGEDGFPAGSTTATPGNGNGGVAEPRDGGPAEPGPPPASTPAEPPAASTPAPPAAGPLPGSAGGGPLVGKSTQSRLSRKFQDMGWTGEDYRDRRRVMSCYMAARDTGRPARMVASVAEMTEAEAAHAVEVAESLLASVGGDLGELAAKLQAAYDARAQQQAAQAAQAQAAQG